MNSVRLAGSTFFLSLALACSAVHADTPTPVTPPVYFWTADTIDPDQLAARLPYFQDLYRNTRDQSLDAWRKGHANAAPSDEARRLIGLTSYLLVWSDPFGEGLWSIERQLAEKPSDGGDHDPLLLAVLEITDDDDIPQPPADLAQACASASASAYPPLLKQRVAQCCIWRMLHPGVDITSPPPVFDTLLSDWIKASTALVDAHAESRALFRTESTLLQNMNDRAEWLDKGRDAVNQTFVDEPDSPVRVALQGAYLTDRAWVARSSGFANSVSQNQWDGFNHYLQMADDELETGYVKSPRESSIALEMLTVELGQGQGRDRMEQWFRRAIDADPYNISAYESKFYYLQPRWFGSDQDLVAFGNECMQLKGGPPRVLTAYFNAMSTAHQLEKDLYVDSDVWTSLEAAYRQYLDAYPQSITYRTQFAMDAVDGKHWDAAREQFKILGENWDRSEANESDYRAAVALASNPDAAAPETPTAPPAQPVTVLSITVAVARWLLGWL